MKSHRYIYYSISARPTKQLFVHFTLRVKHHRWHLCIMPVCLTTNRCLFTIHQCPSFAPGSWQRVIKQASFVIQMSNQCMISPTPACGQYNAGIYLKIAMFFGFLFTVVCFLHSNWAERRHTQLSINDTLSVYWRISSLIWFENILMYSSNL